MLRIAAAALSLLAAFPAAALKGRIMAADTGAPLPYSVVGLLDANRTMTAHAMTDRDGRFAIDGEGAFLVVQPPSITDEEYHRPQYMPGIYLIEGANPLLEIQVSRAETLLLEVRDGDGELIRWSEMEQRGTFGGVFAYATDERNTRVLPGVVWPVHDEASRAQGAPREMGVPAFVHSGAAYVFPHLLYWPSKASPGGHVEVRILGPGELGYTVGAINVNLDAAQSMVSEYRMLAGRFVEAAQGLPTADALAAKLEDATTQQADAVFEEAVAAQWSLADALAKDAAPNPDKEFTFGVFQGGAFQPEPFAKARSAGFEMATVLPAWGWTDLATPQKSSAMASHMGLARLERMGFALKAHGVVWMQEYGILPEAAKSLATPDAVAQALAFQRRALEAWHGRIGLWEVVNEPSSTNAVGLSREQMRRLMQQAAANIKGYEGLTSLVNGSHFTDYGRKYGLLAPSGEPVDDFPTSYWQFLSAAAEANALKDIDVIGLQYYPWFHFAERLGGYRGPGATPAQFIAMLDRYAQFGKPLHVTEFSVPSEGLGLDGQARVVRAIFALAYAHPACESITYWDLTERGASVVSGGLLDGQNRSKPAFEAAAAFIQQVQTVPEETP